MWKTSFIKEKALACRKLPWTDYLCLRKFFLMKEKYWLVEENFLDKRKFFACGKLPKWRKNLCLWKASLMKEKPLLVESFLDEQNIFAWGKLPLWRKNLWLCKTFLMKENSWLVEKFCYCGKIIALSLLKMKPSNKTNASVETIKISMSKSLAKS